MESLVIVVDYLLSHSWSWGSTGEMGVHTLAVTTDETDPAFVADAARVNFEDAYIALTQDAYLASNVQYTQVVANQITDLSTGDLNAGFISPATISGGGAALPPQCSVAFSLTAGSRPNGAPIRGRFYLPTPSQNAIAADGTLENVARTFYADWASSYLDGLIGVGMTPCVWSRVLALMSPVVSARIGDVVDTIRSRREQLPENHEDATPAALAPA